MGMQYRIRAGGYTGGPVPVGTRVVGAAGRRKLERDPDLGDRIAAIWPMLVAGRSLEEVADHLTAAEIPAPKTGSRTLGRWTKQSVHTLVSNARLVGLLVDQAQFDATAAAMATRRTPRRPAGAHAGTSDRSWLLQGIGRCARCGAAMTGYTAWGRGRKPHHYLTCSARRKLRSACTQPDLPAEVYETAVLDALGAIAKDPDLEAELLAGAPAAEAKAGKATQEHHRLGMQRDQLRVHIGRVVALVADGDLAGDDARPELRRMQEEAARLEHEMATLAGMAAGQRVNQQAAEAMAHEFREGVANLAGRRPSCRQPRSSWSWRQ